MRRRLGVLGTLVWDTIHRRGGRREPVEEWGGISYALAAATAALPEGWEIVPILKVGNDLSERALRFLRTIPRVDVGPGVKVVPQPNNRVELSYNEEGRRTEKLSGGVPPWGWMELAPLVRECDALYVNFIAGFEMELDTARALRSGYDGPTYADLHSLFLGVGREGVRVPRTLPSWRGWLRSFDAVQMNEDEFDLLGRDVGDPWALAAEVVGPELKLVTVTLGARGAGYVASPSLDPDPDTWPAQRERMAAPGAARSGRVSEGCEPADGDPTGSGDVWGATFFSRLLAGASLEEAMIDANRKGARNVSHMGARGLHHHLEGRLAPGGGSE
ncbi:MAG: carbohydrate kinase family protein [Longimicrobiales bacterium]|nr:carbohydrate kinase family protein [Longimicrobiales bacterium]